MARRSIEAGGMPIAASSTDTGGERERPRVAAAAAAIFVPSLVKSAGTAGETQGRLIEWAAPAPGWLLALCSGAFFLLAFLAFSQYRRRVTRTLGSGENEGAALSTSSRRSSGPAQTSLPDASGQGLLDFFFPPMFYRATETFVGAAPCPPQHASAEPTPTSWGGTFFALRGDVFSDGWVTFGAPASVVAAAASSGRASSSAADGLPAVGALPSTCAAAGSAGTAAAAAAPRMLAAAFGGPAGRRDFEHHASDTSSQVRSAAPATGNRAAGSVSARGVAASAAHTAPMKESCGSPSSIPAGRLSSAWSGAMLPSNVEAAATVVEAPACKLLRRTGDSVACRSIVGQLPREGNRSDAEAAPRRAPEEGVTKEPHFFVRLPSVQADPNGQNATPRCACAATRNTASAREQRGAAATAAAGYATVAASKCDGGVPYGTATCTASAGFARSASVAAYNTSAATSTAAAAAYRAAGSCRSAVTRSSLNSVRDCCASSPLLLRAREVVVHGATRSRRRTFPRTRGKDFIAQPIRSGALATAEEQRTSTEAVELERSGRAATRVPGGAAADAGQRAGTVSGAESVTGESADGPGAVEEACYSLLAADEEDSAAVVCAARPAFAFDGASMRSWILAIVAVAALLRAFLLLLQLVANPLEGIRATAAVTDPLPVRSSVPLESSIPWHEAVITEKRDPVRNSARIDAASAVSNRKPSILGVRARPNLSAMFVAPPAGSAALSTSRWFAAAEMMLPAAKSALNALPDGSGVVSSASLSSEHPDDVTLVPSARVQLHPSPAASSNVPSSPLSVLPVTCGTGADGAAAPESLSYANTRAPSMFFLPGTESAVLSLKPLPRAASLQSLPLPASPEEATQRRRTEAETAAVSKGAEPAAPHTQIVCSPAATDKVNHPQTPAGYGAGMLTAAGQATAASRARATAVADAAPFVSVTLEPQGGAPETQSRSAAHPVTKKRYEGPSKADGNSVECDTSVSSSTTPCNSGDMSLVSGNASSSGSVRSVSSNHNSRNSSVKNISDSLRSGERNKPREIFVNKGRRLTRRSGSSTNGVRSRRALRTKQARRNPGSGRQRTHVSSKRKHITRSSNISPKPPSSSGGGQGSNSAGRGRVGWPSALWLRTLARSLPPMLCLEAYALLILFLMDLFYASSRLENVRWIAVGSYIFLGGVWVLFLSIAGLTVAEDSTRREAAHLFARSVCCLLGFCFTLLSVSLAVVGTLVLQQLRGRASTHMFFPSPLMLPHAAPFKSGSAMRAAAASEVFRPPRTSPHFAATFLRGGTAACRSVAAWKGDAYRCACTEREPCHTHRDRKQLQVAATAGRSDSWLPTCLERYRSPNPPATPVAAAALLEEQLDQLNNAAAATLPSLRCFENEQREDTQRTSLMRSFSWGEQQQQRLLASEVYGRRHARRKTINHAQGRSLFLLPMNLLYLTCFNETENTESSPSGTRFVPSYSTAWRRLFMLTLCCPPLLMMRGIHLLLVGAQVFPHYYPFFVEEKGTFDVLMYLMTEWLPLTLLVCALSKTVPSKRRCSSTATHATVLGDAHNPTLCAVHSPFLQPSQPLFPCRNDCRDSSRTAEWPRRFRSKGSAGPAVTARVHQPYGPFFTPTYTAAICASQAQPPYLEQRTVQGQQHEEEKHRAVKTGRHRSLCGVKEEQHKICHVRLLTDELASHTFPESSTGQQASTKMWRRVLYHGGKQKSPLLKESKWKERSCDEHFRVPFLTEDVLRGSEALRLTQQQHGSGSSSSSSSRRDSDGRRSGAEQFRTSS